MAVYVRPFVKSITHMEGCTKRRCGPQCKRETNGWEYHLKLVLPNGDFFEERKKSPLAGKADSKRYAEDRAAFVARFGRPPEQEANGPVEEPAPTIVEFWPRYIEEHCEASRLKPSTIAQKKLILEHYLKPRIGERRLDEIRDSDVAKLKADLKGLSPKTVNNVLVTLNTVLKSAKEWGVIKYLPCTIKLLKTTAPTVEFYDSVQYERLVDAARQLDPRIELLVRLGGDAGLRRGEIIALDQIDADTRRGLLNVRRSEWKGHVTLPKSGRERQVDMTDRRASGRHDRPTQGCPRREPPPAR